MYNPRFHFCFPWVLSLRVISRIWSLQKRGNRAILYHKKGGKYSFSRPFCRLTRPPEWSTKSNISRSWKKYGYFENSVQNWTKSVSYFLRYSQISYILTSFRGFSSEIDFLKENPTSSVCAHYGPLPSCQVWKNLLIGFQEELWTEERTNGHGLIYRNNLLCRWLHKGEKNLQQNVTLSLSMNKAVTSCNDCYWKCLPVTFTIIRILFSVIIHSYAMQLNLLKGLNCDNYFDTGTNFHSSCWQIASMNPKAF